MCVDVPSSYVLYWMLYCIHQSDIDSLHYVHVDEFSPYDLYWKFYSTPHNDMDDPKFLHLYVLSSCFRQWKLYLIITAIWTHAIMYTFMYLHLTFGTEILLHTSQRYKRSPLCLRWGTFILRLVLKVLLHLSQQYRRPLFHIRLCIFILRF